MNKAADVMNRINDRYNRFSKGNKIIAAYISEEYEKAAFYTAAKLGEQVGVSESTVVRFANTLGYKGYPEFQKALEEYVIDKLNSQNNHRVSFGKLSEDKILSSVLNEDLLHIRETMEAIDESAFELAVDLIDGAKNIYVIGLRQAAPFASFLTFYLNLMFDRVHLLTSNSSSEIFEQMVRIGKDDVIIGISFPRYSMRTLKALEFANNRACKVITITDTVHSPMNLYSSCNLIAKSSMASFVDSFVAPLSVINALIISLAMKNQREVVRTLDELENIWDDYQVYSTDEIDYLDDKLKLRYHKPEK